eukprot:Lithocolla_globosa_v1_NODE_6329_length_1103_cov_7.305344.p1 type:complete len:345 gc:universal NODE_6329_length_1103_cov_7.305344:1041-7(-)
MPCCGESDEAKGVSKDIDKDLKNDKEKAKRTYKILLLGAGECGKSTIMKQLHLIYREKGLEKNRETWIDQIRVNSVDSMKSIISCWEVPDDLKEYADKLKDFDSQDQNATPEMGVAVTKLFENPKVMEIYDTKANELRLIDNAPYFMKESERVCAENYVPTIQDILNCRIMTTGINDELFEKGGKTFHVFDVGGQRSERRKWMHHFSDVHSVLFVTSLSEYNQTLREDENTNRTTESIKLFKETINNEHFKNTPVMLFLNKKDLFEEKLSKYPLSDLFSEFGGGHDYKEACDFMTKRYMEQNQNRERTIYPHLTCATSTDNITQIWKVVIDIITENALKAVGML